MKRYELQLADSSGRMRSFRLATDAQGHPLWKTSILDPLQPTAQIGEATYASFAPRLSGVYSQGDLSGGAGKKVQAPGSSADSNRYYYTEWLDASVEGQVQKGPAVTFLNLPSMGALTGYFELAGVSYLVGTQQIAYISGASLFVARNNAGAYTHGNAAVFMKLAAEASIGSSTGDTTTDTITTADGLIAEQFRSATSGVQYLSSVSCKLVRAGSLLSIGAPTVTVVGAAGATTDTYAIVAVNAAGEFALSAATSVTNGNATQTTTNYNNIVGPTVSGAVQYRLYRTAGGANQGLIATSTSTSFSDTGLSGDASSAPATTMRSILSGDVRLRVVGDRDSKPDLSNVLTTTRMLAATVSTTATAYTFRIEYDDLVPIAFHEPMWFVLDAVGATSTETMGWRRGGTDTFTLGLSATSTDSGNSWTTSSGVDYYFTANGKIPTETVYVGTNTSGTAFATSTDGATYSADTTFSREAALFCTVGDRIVRDQRGKGAINWSTDGTNWDGTIDVGDTTTAITALVRVRDWLLICKTDSLWACDITNDQSLTLLDSAPPVSTNGQGAWEWKGTGYVPFNGRLAAVDGDFESLTFYRSIGPESMPEWDFPHGAGRVVAGAGDRFYNYAILSATGGFRVYKSSVPLTSRWHGSIATIEDGSQTVSCAFVRDPGGTSSPHLYVMSTGSANVADVVLPRVPNPSSDGNYLYDITTAGDLYLPRCSGLLWGNPKDWQTETVTFQQNRSGDYVDLLYDTLDGLSWRRVEDKGGRIWDTDILRYKTGLTSLLLARRLRLVNSSQTYSPLLLASGVTFAVRPQMKVPLRHIEFTALAEDNLSASSLGDSLGIGAQTTVDLLDDAALTGGTRTLVGPFGKTYGSVEILDAEPMVLDLRSPDSSSDGGALAIHVTAAQVG